jgi:MarR family transcriptional regulator, transcriptional regulator for hemolysin
MAMPYSDPKREAGLRIVETSRLLRSLVEQRLRPFGMTRVQFATLGKLERQPGLTQSEMAEMLEVQPIALVRLIDQLSSEGLIERRPDPHDRRVNRLFLTEAGKAKLLSMSSFKEELGAEVFDGIAGPDLAQLLATLERIHHNIKSIQAAESTVGRTRKASAP